MLIYGVGLASEKNDSHEDVFDVRNVMSSTQYALTPHAQTKLL